MKNLLRFRYIFMTGGTAAIMAYLYISDPNNGDLTLPFLAKLATPVIAVWFAHLARRSLFDYLDMSELLAKAKNSAIGSAIVFLGVCVVISGLLGLFGSQVYAQNVTTYIPEKANVYFATLIEEQKTYWPTHPKYQP